MKKILLFSLLMFTIIWMSNAQETKYVSGGIARQMALGGNPMNPYIIDYTSVFINPAYSVRYTDLLYSELGYNFAGYRASGQTVGFTYAVFKGLAVGLLVGKQEGPVFAANSYGNLFGGQTTDADNFISGMNNALNLGGYSSVFSASTDWHPLQVYGSFNLGGLMLGAALYRVGWSTTDDFTASGATENTKNEASISQTGLKVGTLIDLDVMMLDASALLRFNSATAKFAPPAPSTSDEITALGTELALNARLFMKFSNKFSLIPMARFSTFGYEPEFKSTIPANNKLNAKPDNYGRTEFEIGVGTNITVTGGQVFAGVSLETISLKKEETRFVNGAGPVAADTTKTETTKYSTSVLSLPKVHFGAEFEITSWLTGRLGYFKTFSTLTSTTELPAPGKKQESTMTYDFVYCPPYNTTSNRDQLLSLGFGIHFDRLSIDGYLCEEWLADGPYIVSGIGNSMFGVLSMSYSFN